MQQYYCKNARRDSRLCFRTDTSRMHQRKLLGYERNFCVRPMRHRKFNGMHRDIIAATSSRLTERKHDIVARDIEPTDKNTGEIRHIDLIENAFCKNVVELK